MVKLYHEWKCREALDFNISVPVDVITALTNNINDDNIDDPHNIHEI